ncbi:hypothetical protein [Allokutzneria albata]|uniref:Uncharacterized protein n=1 Tax=Allokutzneria albata TaxID=211114 RepID=A0A1G9TVT3_ALLAB|nr:hypothetical protein [Allokutzneria albata]SDM51708.1 hypothetical protein SAMN04489726_2019 [Allokutzneria albata]
MTEPSPLESEPREPHAEDYEDPEEFADAVGVDPTPQQVDDYKEATEEPPD